MLRRTPTLFVLRAYVDEIVDELGGLRSRIGLSMLV